MKRSLDGILGREKVEIPKYDFMTHSRCSDYRVISEADVVLLEGILVLYDPTVRALMNMKLFVDTDSDTRLSRRGDTCTHTHTSASSISVVGDTCTHTHQRQQH